MTPAMATKEPIVRVTLLDENKGAINVKALDFMDVVNDSWGSIKCVSDLPKLVQERLNLLRMVDPTPPTEWIEDVGRRIDKSTFWIYRD